MFTVALIGPDGAGKTTIARRLEQSGELPVKCLYMGIGSGSRRGTSSARRLFQLRRGGLRPGRAPYDGHFQLLHSLWRLVVLVGRFAEEWYRQLLAWIYKKQGRIILCDRHYRLDFANEIGEPNGRRNFVDRLHRWLLAHLYPMPDLVLYLDAPGDLLFARKGEHNPEWLESRRQSFRRLGKRLPNFIQVDASRSLEAVEAEVLRHVLDYRERRQALAAVPLAVQQAPDSEPAGQHRDRAAGAASTHFVGYGPVPGRLLDYIREQAARYYPELSVPRLQVKLAAVVQRQASVACRYEISDGKTQRLVRVKLPSPASTLPPFGSESPTASLRLEYEALLAIQEHFTALHDARFGVIRVLDFVPDYPAIVMEDLSGPTLRRVFLDTARWHARPARERAYRGFRNAGAWLRAFHSIPAKEEQRNGGADPAEVAQSIARNAQVLGEILSEGNDFRGLAEEAAAQVSDLLARPLPVGLRHGDFAMRNLLCDGDSRITASDTRARSRVVCYQDLAYFLTESTTLGLQRLTGGLAFDRRHLVRCEQEFLQGYFQEEPPPQGALRLYRTAALLEKWATRARSKSVGSAWYLPRKMLHHAAGDWFFRRTLMQVWQSPAT